MQISLENLYVDTGVTKLLSFSSAEASLCRREAGEREKERARAPVTTQIWMVKPHQYEFTVQGRVVQSWVTITQG